MICRMCEILSHSSVHMNSEHFQICTAVRPSDAAGITVSAVNIRIYHNTVSDSDSILVIFGDRFYYSCQLMSDHSRISDEPVCPAECSNITSTDPCCNDPDQCLPLLWCRFLHIHTGYIPWFFQFYCFHFLRLSLFIFDLMYQTYSIIDRKPRPCKTFSYPCKTFSECLENPFKS